MTNAEAREWLDEVEKRVNAATDGPWKPVEDTEIDTANMVASVVGPPSDYMYLRNTHDAIFIAHARTDIPLLLALAAHALTLGEAGEVYRGFHNDCLPVIGNPHAGNQVAANLHNALAAFQKTLEEM